MASDYKTMATSIIQGLGGTGNLTNVTHCATRLRVVVKDPAKINQAETFHRVVQHSYLVQ